MATHSLKDVKIRLLALTRRGANKNRKSTFKADGLGEMFSDLSDKEKEIMKNKKPGNLAKVDFLLEVLDVVDELRKGELKTDDAADFLENIVKEAEKNIPVEKNEEGGEGDKEETLSLDATREVFGIEKVDAEEKEASENEVREMFGLTK